MEVFRYKIVFVVIALSLNRVSDEKSTESTTEHNIATCPFTKIIEDIFKIHNKSSDSSYTSKDSERVKIFLNSITNITGNENTSNIDNQEDLVNKIIESINKIKHNITYNKNDSETNLNEAIILSIPKQNGSDTKNATKEEGLTKRVPIKSGIEDKIDITQTQIDNIKNKTATENNTTTTERINYVEILTIEPNNTNGNDTSSHNIIDVLKHLMPLFNSTLTKELHNITIIERNHHKNHSFTATKNVSTIVVTYCDKENLTKSNLSNIDSIMKIDKKKGESEDYYSDNSDDSDGIYDSAEYDDSKPDANVTGDENKDLIEAAEYGMKKMHELYTILEPKLYSMGLWLDDTNPARYVAAFNAPAEEAAKFSRFGYASLQAATRLKQLTRLVDNYNRLVSYK
ncbi:unnamed protein product [Diatraea saccharalis]|uniref:Uncharacterized protein n=1 Tax=Diatraea saccharalis TaxID=40085 RepID=A0A9N9QZH1_9NEOP|nr:unnamed protein product [Diatraea saccharalis]